MARLMRMPEGAAGGTSAVLHEWSVAERAEFGPEDVLATVETDKAVVDVEADQPGVVVKLLVPSGSTVEVGAPIAVLADPGETVGDVDALLAALGVADEAAAGAAPPDPEGAPDQPLSPPVRRAIARRLTESKQTVPHFTLRATIRVDALLGLRAELAAIGTTTSVTDL